MSSSSGKHGRTPLGLNSISDSEEMVGLMFLIEDENGVEIEVNGTIDNLHTEQINGVLVEDTLLLDGIYTGTVSGSFGSVRMISDSGKQLNSEGVEHDVL